MPKVFSLRLEMSCSLKQSINGPSSLKYSTSLETTRSLGIPICPCIVHETGKLGEIGKLTRDLFFWDGYRFGIKYNKEANSNSTAECHWRLHKSNSRKLFPRGLWGCHFRFRIDGNGSIKKRTSGNCSVDGQMCHTEGRKLCWQQRCHMVQQRFALPW